MASEETRRLLRHPEAPKRATLLELLLDVVYVAALALLSMRLAEAVTWTAAAEILVLLMGIWWVWSITALLTDFYNPDEPKIQIIVGWAMLGSIVLTASIPQAFSALGWLFAGMYVAIHLVRGIVLVAVLRRHQAQARAARFLCWFTLSGTFWMAGAFLPASTRLVLWGIALVIDYVGAALRYPTPWLGRVPLAQYDKASEHLGERYQQFVILALGDIILVPLLLSGRTGLNAERMGILLLAFATLLLLWQIYVYRAGALLQAAIAEGPGRATRWAPYTHLLMVAGVVSTATGFELLVSETRNAAGLDLVAVVVGGPTLFLIGRTVFEYELFGTFAWSRLGWLVVLVGTAPAFLSLVPVAVAGFTGAVLLGVAMSDAVRSSGLRRPRRRSGES
ncbi:low temperature requirement protein A [Plantactinospora endophytica]|uniref:Membrane protein n=1 Tax=Plantactinospora endophytica TaxID=673535 RepID=A0ABQ4E9T7_9ACTN|nr:low temperature requirement protein A [Plantactinospora endophytica]GIG91495.1 membrane protein [Plantactinospora endophytica]